jgi:hypothetical protein
VAGVPARGAGALLGGGEAPLGGGQEGETRGRERDGAGGALEEADAEVIFELLDALAEGGGPQRDGAEVEQARGGDEAAESVEGGEGGAEGRHAPFEESSPGVGSESPFFGSLDGTARVPPREG